MEIVDIVRITPSQVKIGQPIQFSFKIIGAIGSFEFPFSNESLITNKIIFVKGANGNV